MQDNKQSASEDTPPPILGTWKRVYYFVMATFGLFVLLFYLFTKAFE